MGSAKLRKRSLVRRYALGEAWACSSADGPRLLLEGEPASRPALERIRDAHERIASPHVAKVTHADLDGPTTQLVFDCPAVVDLDLVVDASSQSGIRLGFPAAVAFNDLIVDTLEAAHRADPPSCLGALGWRNVLIGIDGSTWLFGFGENFPALNSEGRFANAGSVSVAPEVAFNSAVTPSADVYAVFAFIRSLLPHVDIYETYARAAAGEVTGTAFVIRSALMDLSADILAKPAEERPDNMAALRSRYRALRGIDPQMPPADDAGLQTFLEEIAVAASGDLPAPTSRSTTTLTIDLEHRRFELGDASEAVDLSRRRPLWLVFSALVETHQNGGRALTVEDLQNAGWPDEKILPEAGRARVYVAVSTLRRLGLGDMLDRIDEGYRLAPATTLRTSPLT